MTPFKTSAKDEGGHAAQHKKKPVDNIPTVKPKLKKQVKKVTPTAGEIAAAAAVMKELEVEKVEKTVLEYVDCTSCN